MDYGIIIRLKQNIKMYNYLKDNSYLIKHLNRYKLNYDDYEKMMKEKYKIRMTDKVSSAMENMDLVVNILDILK